jgi:hypothetical protein
LQSDAHSTGAWSSSREPSVVFRLCSPGRSEKPSGKCREGAPPGVFGHKKRPMEARAPPLSAALGVPVGTVAIFQAVSGRRVFSEVCAPPLSGIHPGGRTGRRSRLAVHTPSERRGESGGGASSRACPPTTSPRTGHRPSPRRRAGPRPRQRLRRRRAARARPMPRGHPFLPTLLLRGCCCCRQPGGRT